MYLLLFLLAMPVHADHNSKLDGYSDKRGYTRENCESMFSKETGKQAEWLGHLVGCMVENSDGYVLIMEYEVKQMDKPMGDKLRFLIDGYTEPEGTRM